jgi:hypothetical protein
MPRYEEDFPEYYPEDYRDQIRHEDFDVFDRLPGVEWLDESEREDVFEAFWHGFIENDWDRSYFFDMTGMDQGDFPWEDWREFMGYDD